MMTDQRPPYFPMMIDISGLSVLIVGGGHIASRRADTLKRCGAEITAISPEFSLDFPEGITRLTRAFSPEDITCDFVMVIAATDSRAVNRRVHEAARALGVLVNVCDAQGECDFFFPSLVNTGCVGVSVNTAGTSSTLTRILSDRLREVWPLWVKEACRGHSFKPLCYNSRNSPGMI